MRTFAIAAILISFFAGFATAQSKTGAAREAAENGRRAYNLNHWTEAIAAFEKAYQLSGDPALLFNLAQAHRQAGHRNDALRFYRAYLREQPNGPNREIAEKQMKELEPQNGSAPPAPAPAPRPATTPPAAPAPMRPPAAPTPPPAAPPPLPAATAPPPAAPAPPPAVTAPRPAAPPPAHSSIAMVTPTAAPAPAPTAAPTIVAPAEPVQPKARTPLPRWLPLAGAVATAGLMTAAIMYGVSASNRYDELSSTCGQTPAGCPPGDIDGVRSRDRTATALWIATGVVAAGTGVAVVVNARAAGVSALWRF